MLEKILGQLATDKRKTLAAALERDRAQVPWRTLRGPQTQLLEAAQSVDMILAAGAAGSAKTDGAIGAVLQNASSARFVRGTVGELTEILRRVAAITGSVSGRNLQDQRWEIPAPWGYRQGGLAVSWAGLSDEGQALKVQGRPTTALVCDDAASGWLTENALNFVRQWLRTTGTEKVTTILTANPPTSRDSLYLRDELFAPWLAPDHPNPAKSGEVRYFVRGEEVDAATPGAESRTVITSLTSDNPYYVRSGYADRLKNISDPVLRARLALNDWSAGFEDDDPFQCLPSSWIEQAMHRWTPDAPCKLSALGVDAARGGGDRSVIARRHGTWFAPPIVILGCDTPDGQSLAARVLAAHKSSCTVFVDSIGIGSSVYDHLVEHVRAVSINAGAGTKTLDRTQTFGFANLRAMLVWRFRELLDPSNPNAVALPPDKLLAKELAMFRYSTRSGKLLVESKDEIKKRLKRSPDLADAYFLAAIRTDAHVASNQNTALRRAIAESNRLWREEMKRRDLHA